MKYLSSTPNIMGGDLVIKGTRIPIEVILYRIKDGYSVDQIHELYPWVLDEAINLLAPKLHGEEIL
jgi:uncharacterized protein (DUF433 family)